MIRDIYLRILFIPILGIAIPLLSGIINYTNYSVTQLVAINIYFVLVSFGIWNGCLMIHAWLRRLYGQSVNPFFKITSYSLLTAIFGVLTGGLLILPWIELSGEVISLRNLYMFAAMTGIASIVFTLLYEILYLSKERELDSKIVKQLDRELTQAEMTALRNELDPHFIFNSLTTLSYLILNDPQKAHMFNEKLAKVFRYFLINKNRELIPLEDELEFIESYFFLLRIRHDDKLKLFTELREDLAKVMILPCALQILVENAIKHNEFTEMDPLNIRIAMNGKFLKVINNIKPKPYLINSTGIGLKNLSSRYKLVCKRNIAIESTAKDFIVKLPLITDQNEAHVKHYYH